MKKKLRYKRFLFVDSEKVSKKDTLQDSMKFRIDITNDNIDNVDAMNLESFIVPSTFILFDEQEVNANEPNSNKIIISPTIYKPIKFDTEHHDKTCNDVTNYIQRQSINMDISKPWYYIDDTNRIIVVKKIENMPPVNREDVYPNIELNKRYDLLVLNCKSGGQDNWIIFLSLVKSVSIDTRSQAMNMSISVLETNINVFKNKETEENEENIIDSMYSILNQITKEKKTFITHNKNREVVKLFTITLKTGVYTKKTILHEINAQQIKSNDRVISNVCFELVDDGKSSPYLQLNVNDISTGPLMNENTVIGLMNIRHEIQSLRKRFIRFEFKELSTGKIHKIKVPIPEESNDLRLEREVMNRTYFFLNTDTQSLEGDTTLPFRQQIEMTVNETTNSTYFERVPWATSDFEITIDVVATEVLDNIEIIFIGNYNIDEVEQHIQEKIQPLKDLSFRIDRNTLKSSFMLNNTTIYIHDITVKLGSKVSKLLGYTEINSNFVCDQCNPLNVASFGFNAIKHKYLYMCADTRNDRKSTIMNVYNNYDNNNLLTEILGIIYLPEGPYGLNMMQHATLVGNNRIFFNKKVKITTIDISLRTPEGTIVRLNGQQIFFVLSFEVEE